jgi:hypothetical protein
MAADVRIGWALKDYTEWRSALPPKFRDSYCVLSGELAVAPSAETFTKTTYGCTRCGLQKATGTARADPCSKRTTGTTTFECSAATQGLKVAKACKSNKAASQRRRCANEEYKAKFREYHNKWSKAKRAANPNPERHVKALATYTAWRERSSASA